MINNIFEKIAWYTTPSLELERRLEREYLWRQGLLRDARDCEALAAAWQSLADSIREAATA